MDEATLVTVREREATAEQHGGRFIGEVIARPGRAPFRRGQGFGLSWWPADHPATRYVLERRGVD